MNYADLLKKVEEYMTAFLSSHQHNNFLYHHPEYARGMVDKALSIATYCKLDEQTKTIIAIAAWFYHSGFVLQKKNDEQKSAALATEFLRSISANESDIAVIQACIMATSAPQEPKTLAEQIICDAATYHFGEIDFKEKNKLLRKEAEILTGSDINGTEWSTSMISMMQNHQYYTDYCRSLLQGTKEANLKALTARQEKKMQKNIQPVAEETHLNDKVLLAKTKKQPEKSVDTMFRIAAANNVRISSMADNKAHIMITVNSIIISLVLGFIVRNMQDVPHYILPAVILLAMSVGTVIFAVLATRPKASNGTFTQKQVEEKSVNLMFFGSYHQMNYDEYKQGMQQMMSDHDFLYNSLTKDLFWQGKVLGRKYRLLHISYGIFMYGLIIAVLAFIAVYLFY